MTEGDSQVVPAGKLGVGEVSAGEVVPASLDGIPQGFEASDARRRPRLVRTEVESLRLAVLLLADLPIELRPHLVPGEEVFRHRQPLISLPAHASKTLQAPPLRQLAL